MFYLSCELECWRMKARTIIYAAILVAVTVIATVVALNVIASTAVFAPKHLVHVRYDGEGVAYSVVGDYITVVFLKDNSTVTSCVVSAAIVPHVWQNITVPEGAYVVKLYNAGTGVFIKQLELYVAKEIWFEASPY